MGQRCRKDIKKEEPLKCSIQSQGSIGWSDEALLPRLSPSSVANYLTKKEARKLRLVAANKRIFSLFSFDWTLKFLLEMKEMKKEGEKEGEKEREREKDRKKEKR